MHPALSVIIFTTASGAGYGLLALLGLFAALGTLPPDPALGYAGFAIGGGLVTVGLLSSTFHLGHPERAWRAFSQWRSSWLSREGVIAVLTYVPAALFAYGWLREGSVGDVWRLAAVATAVLSVLTVLCTAMIYASLKPIPRWSNGWVPPVYLLLALMTGALWLNLLTMLCGLPRREIVTGALIATAAAALAKVGYWLSTDRARPRATAESATGLGGFGKVRQLEAPHTEANYLMREMGHRIARRHAGRLRRIALLLAFATPLTLTTLTLVLLPTWAGAAIALLAVTAATAGVLIERWLFFAEAQHVVTLYYGTAAV